MVVVSCPDQRFHVLCGVLRFDICLSLLFRDCCLPFSHSYLTLKFGRIGEMGRRIQEVHTKY